MLLRAFLFWELHFEGALWTYCVLGQSHSSRFPVRFGRTVSMFAKKSHTSRKVMLCIFQTGCVQFGHLVYCCIGDSALAGTKRTGHTFALLFAPAFLTQASFSFFKASNYSFYHLASDCLPPFSNLRFIIFFQVRTRKSTSFLG